ncbi:HU family DNA-binding protein [Patescibacteria group bacterium AH-259-L07]|nr:HU family DNA-binding protein [Patescibacteria group bacterium AH-259-L07]
MNKRELIEELYKKAGACSKIEAENYLNSLVTIIKSNLKKGDKVTIAGFGTFSTKVRKARSGVDPQTGKKIKIPKVRVAKFTTGSALKRAVK